MAIISAARKAAFEALRRIHGGGLSDVALLEECRGLEARDAGLAHTIVYGVLRHQAQLEHLAKVFSGRKILVLDATTAILLYMGIYQLRYLTKIPAHAAVMESVELAKRLKKRSAAGLINAVLRKVDKRPVKWPDEATELSMPAWLWRKWTRELGLEAARAAAQAALEPPARKGMDEGAESIVPLLDLKPGDRLLDLCAAPGNKARQAAALGARVFACDRSPRRLAGLQDQPFPLVLLDAARPLPFRAEWTKILADAPCSGTGTLSRNPEIKWRLSAEDLTRHQERQIAIVREARSLLAPGGTLVYSTCSLEKEENEEVVQAACPEEAIPWVRRLPGRDPGDGFFAAIIPATS